MNQTTIRPPAISPEALAHLGDGQIAYVKTIRSEDVSTLFPQAPQIAPGLKLFALHAADGTPIMITDSREAAVASRTTNPGNTSIAALPRANSSAPSCWRTAWKYPART